MKKLFLLSLLFCCNLFAQDFFPIPATSFTIKSTNVEEKFNQTLTYPENLLKRFNPEGAVISNKTVSGNTIQFKATKTIAIITKSVKVVGVLDSSELKKGCAANEKGYLLTLNLDGSDREVIENIDRLEAAVCADFSNSSQMNAKVTGKIVKGSNFTMLIGGVVKGVIEAQVNPLIKALTNEIKSMQ
jgi:hypothetical protein